MNPIAVLFISITTTRSRAFDLFLLEGVPALFRLGLALLQVPAAPPAYSPQSVAHPTTQPDVAHQVLQAKIDVLPIDEILVMLSHLDAEDIDENKLFKTAEQLRARISNAQVVNMLAAAERAQYVLEMATPGS